MAKIDFMISTAIYDVSRPCNYRCIYCRNDWSNPDNSQHVNIEVIKENILLFKKKNFSRIIFTGGEFFIIPYWKEILEFSKKLEFEIWIISNGYSITENDVDFIRKYVDKINVSFHANNSVLYNKIMKPPTKTAYKTVLTNTKNLSDAGVRIGIFFSPLKENVDCFYDTIHKLIEYGIKLENVNINRIVATQYTNDYFYRSNMLNFFDHRYLVQQAIKIYKELNIDISLEGYPYCFLKSFIKEEDTINKLIEPCMLGRKAIAFNYDGSIKLCPATHFSIGYIKENKAITENEKLIKFQMNNWRNEKCVNCQYWDQCLGGCHAVTGDLFADDPLLMDDDIFFEEGIDTVFFDILVALYKPFLSSAYKKAPIQYTIFSSKYSFPIGIIALNKTKSGGNFIEIALIPKARGKYYSFQIINLFLKKHNLNRIGWTVYKSNLPSIKLLKKLRGGFFEKTVRNKKRIEAEGFFKVDMSVSKSMQKAINELIIESKSQYKEWLREYNKRTEELQDLEVYLREYDKK